MMKEDEIQRSEILAKALRDLEDTKPDIDMRWRQRNSSGELHELVMHLLVSERIGPPAETESLRVALAKKLKERDQERDDYSATWSDLAREIEKYTRPAIAEGLAKISTEVRGLKFEESTLGRDSGGYTMKGRVRLSTNRDAIFAAQKIAGKAPEVFSQLRYSTIRAVRELTEMKLKEIRGIDMTQKEKLMDEADYERSIWVSSPVR